MREHGLDAARFILNCSLWERARATSDVACPNNNHRERVFPEAIKFDMALFSGFRTGKLSRGMTASTSRPLLHVRRVTNTSEEIYKNLGLQMPTGKEEDEEVKGGHLN